MNALHLFYQFLADQGVMLLAGVSAFLAAGVVGIRLQRSPLHRQRLGELTVLCTLAWLVLACVPLPRLGLRWWNLPNTFPTERPATARPLFLPRTPAPADALSDPELAALLATVTSRPTGTTPGTVATATPTIAPPPRSRLSAIRSALPALYLIGAASCACWLVAGHVILWRMLRRSAKPAPWLREAFDSLRGHLARRRPPRLLVSRECGRPVSCGVFRPTVLLPAACADPANAAQLRHVLLHELAHVRQRDAIGNLLLNLAMPVLYFHPLYWLVRSDVHLARELVADDWAARRTGKSSYVAELVSLARSRLPSAAAGRLAAVGLFLFGSPTHFYRRMHMLMHRRETLPTHCSPRWRFGTAAVCSAALAGAVALCGVPRAAAQAAPDDSKPATSQTVRPVAPVVKGLEAAPVAQTLKARLAEVVQRATELKGQATQARENDKSAQEQLYRAQLQKIEAERAAVEAELRQLRKAEADANRAEGGAKGEGPAREREALQKAREELAVSQKMMAEMMSHAAREADGSRAEVETLKRELAEMRSRLGDQQNRLKYTDLDLERKVAELRKREAQIAKAETITRAEKSRLDALEAAKRQVPTSSSAAPTGEKVARDAAVRDAAAAGDSGGAKLSAGSLDLVALATSYADAVGGVQVARFRVKAAAEKDQPAEEQIQRASLQTAEHKASLLRSIAQIALAGAEAEYKQSRQLVDQGFMSTSKLAEAEAKLKILQVILQSDGQGDSAKRDAERAGAGRE